MDAPILAQLTGSPTQMSYVVVFTLLSASTFVTVLEVVHAANKPANPTVSNLVAALMIESGVNAIAGYFYYTMMQLAAKNTGSAAETIRRLRSIDWSVTTPLMLLSLIYFYGHADYDCPTADFTCVQGLLSTAGGDDLAATPEFSSVALVLGLNALMILIGSPWSPMGPAQTWGAFAVSSLAFGALVYFMYTKFYRRSAARLKAPVSVAFAAVWGLYPVVRVGEIVGFGGAEWSYNMLDLVSKGGFGVFVWAVLHDLQVRCDKKCHF